MKQTEREREEEKERDRYVGLYSGRGAAEVGLVEDDKDRNPVSATERMT